MHELETFFSMPQLRKTITMTAMSALVPIATLMLAGVNDAAPVATLGLLTTAQSRSLQSLGIKIAVPSYVPQGFTVANVKTEPCLAQSPRTANGVCRFGPTYHILYRNPQRTCFEISAIGGGLGGPDPEFVLPVETKLLGSTTLGFGKVPGDGKQPSAKQLTLPQSQIWSWPAGNSPYYQIATVENRAGCGKNLSLTPLEVKKILQSLTWL